MTSYDKCVFVSEKTMYLETPEMHELQQKKQ